MTTTIEALLTSAAEIHRWLQCESEMLKEFHAYAQKYGEPGENVFRLVLKDAQRLRDLGEICDCLRCGEVWLKRVGEPAAVPYPYRWFSIAVG